MQPCREFKEVATQTESDMKQIDGLHLTEEFFQKLKNMLVDIFLGKDRQSGERENIIDEAIQKNFGNGNNEININASNTKHRYITRQRSKEDEQREGSKAANKDIDGDSLEEGVLSSSDAASEVDSVYETIEKRQIRINPTKCIAAEDFMKEKSKV